MYYVFCSCVAVSPINLTETKISESYNKIICQEHCFLLQSCYCIAVHLIWMETKSPRNDSLLTILS